MKAWWLGPDTLPHGDGRKVRVGVTHKAKGKIELCVNGLHASIRPLDSLTYGAGLFYRVGMSGTIIKGDDKLVASERTYLGVVENTDAVLRCFARLCALDVIHLWDAPGVVLQYLKTESLRDAARATADAAWAAADAMRAPAGAADAALAARAAASDAGAAGAAWAAADAARAAAWDAAWAAAAWPASRPAARAAADAAAWAAWDAATWAAARDAADAAADAAAWDVAWPAARAAARAAAQNKQSTRLYRMLMKKVKHD